MVVSPTTAAAPGWTDPQPASTNTVAAATRVRLPIPVRGMRGVALGWQGRGGRRTGVVRRPTITPPDEMGRRADPDRNRKTCPGIRSFMAPTLPTVTPASGRWDEGVDDGAGPLEQLAVTQRCAADRRRARVRHQRDLRGGLVDALGVDAPQPQLGRLRQGDAGEPDVRAGQIGRAHV